jgi:hypothetical protein
VGIYPNRIEPNGDRVTVSGFISNEASASNCTVEVIVQEVNVGTTGKASVTGIGINGMTDFSVTVPANMTPGTFTPGGLAAVATTLRSSSGKQLASDSMLRQMEGGEDPFAMFGAFNDPGTVISLDSGML